MATRKPGYFGGRRVVGDKRPPVYAEAESWNSPTSRKAPLTFEDMPVDKFMEWLAERDERRLAGE